MKAIVEKDTNVLVPNAEHKNFTVNGDIIEEGAIIEGNVKQIKGLRRGEPFVYKLFLTNDNKLIYLKSIKIMDTTEVKLGADAAQSASVINMTPAEHFTKNKIIGLVVGGLAGFAWAKYKKHDMKKAALFIGIGAIAGYGAGVLFDKNKSVEIKPSK